MKSEKGYIIHDAAQSHRKAFGSSCQRSIAKTTRMWYGVVLLNPVVVRGHQLLKELEIPAFENILTC